MTSLEIYREMIEEAGGFDSLMQGMQTFDSLVRKMHSERTDLLEKYPDRWVAIGLDGVIAVTSTLEELIAQIRDKGIADGEYYHDYMNTEPVSYIL